MYVRSYDSASPGSNKIGLHTFEQIDIIPPHFPSNHHESFQSIYNKEYKCLCDFGRFKTYLRDRCLVLSLLGDPLVLKLVL